MSREAPTKTARFIDRKGDLLEIFERGGRPASLFKIGLEAEKLGVYEETGQAVGFDGPKGVEEVLSRLRSQFGYEPTLDRGRLIGLTKGELAITLEPGGQLELSSAPHGTLDEVAAELKEHFCELRAVSGPLGVHWILLGLQPVTPLSHMPWVPKSRYAIMRPYYEKRPGLPLEMMAKTASIQINLDYLHEDDARKKVLVGSALGPVVGAMMANSAIEEGNLNGYCSRRLLIWRHTDPDRCGTPPFFVDGSFSFERYADYALDVPMYFVMRDGSYVDRTSYTFRQFLEGKVEGDRPTTADWEAHLTTLFPDVRLKDHLEFRTMDANRPSRMMAITAFWVGLLYDPDTLNEVFTYLKRFSHSELLSGMDDAAQKGLQATIGNMSILEVAREVTRMAVIGVSRLDRESGRNDLRYLLPLRELLERGKSPAEELRDSWNGTWPDLLRRESIDCEKTKF